MLLVLGSGLKTITLGKSLLLADKQFIIYTPSFYWASEYETQFGKDLIFTFDFSKELQEKALQGLSANVLNDLIVHDRVLRKISKIKSENIIRAYAADIEYLMLKMEVTMILGEQAYAFERCAARLAGIRNVEMRLIEGVKYPEFSGFERVASFNLGRTQIISDKKNKDYKKELCKFRGAIRENDGCYDGTAYKKVKVYEWYFREAISKIWFHIWRAIKYGGDHTQRPFIELVADRITSSIGIALEKFFVCSSLTMPKPFIFIPLHLPEDEAIDTLGREFKNQARMAVDVANALGPDYLVCVKRHPHNKKRFWQVDWRMLYRHPGIVLASQNLETSALMERAVFTLTVCGSASLEAAMLGFKSGTLVPLFFNDILSAGTVKIDEYLSEKIKQPLKSEKELNQYLEHIFQNSYPGIAAVIGLRSEAQSNQNIEKLRVFFGRALP
ncbi:hypothetical protein OA249_03540 [Litorivicinus sp.]|nr:hypothetical protein [Litorivicinus sp.]